MYGENYEVEEKNVFMSVLRFLLEFHSNEMFLPHTGIAEL